MLERPIKSKSYWPINPLKLIKVKYPWPSFHNPNPLWTQLTLVFENTIASAQLPPHNPSLSNVQPWQPLNTQHLLAIIIWSSRNTLPHAISATHTKLGGFFSRCMWRQTWNRRSRGRNKQNRAQERKKMKDSWLKNSCNTQDPFGGKVNNDSHSDIRGGRHKEGEGVL